MSTYKEFLELGGEKKWQDFWESKKFFAAEDFSPKPKYYVLIEFPYPSAEGLHVGHPRSYSSLDVVARKRRMQGFNVLYPIGFDAFGLPAENYAIKTGIHPKDVTEKNIINYRRQLKSIGFSFDWDREVNTTDPKYYKWTQWIFLQLFKHGLAYKAEVAINYCPSCKVGLANEEVVGGKCERCGTEVVKKVKSQWMLKITKYADRLEKDLDQVNYLEKIKLQQKNWIGRSEGAEVTFSITTENVIPSAAEGSLKDTEDKLTVYTTRPDTLFGATYMVLAPEHELVQKLKDRINNFDEVQIYISDSAKKSDLERTELNREKTGVELKGVKAINPVNKTEIPVWISDYVLAGYGTGAIMAVPAHDERDWEFAKKFDLPIIQVVAPMFLAKFEKDKVRPDKETVRRKNVYVIVKHWQDNAFYCLDWAEHNWRSFVMGGIEEGETPEQAAIREMTEETGYKNIKSIKQLGGEIHNNYYAEHKGINRYAESLCFSIELADGSRSEEIDTEHHQGKWLPVSEVKDFINLPSHEWYWSALVDGEKAFIDIDNGIMINSDFLNGLVPTDATQKMTDWLAENGFGKHAVNYKLRDWVFSRQRYWGEPIPLVYCEKCGWVPLPENQLPLELPEVKEFQAGEDGESPLAKLTDWVSTTCPTCGGPAKRETDTMPQWAGSSWYFLRYIDPNNDGAFADQKKLAYWLKSSGQENFDGIDWYNGGMEHTTLHLLYSRFWHKFLFDIGVVPCPEPYAKRTSHGMVLGEGGEKMSKSRGNVVNPDDVVREQGADTLRMYEMFMGPFDQAIPWDTKGVIGVRRFLDRVWNLFNGEIHILSRGRLAPAGEIKSQDYEVKQRQDRDDSDLRLGVLFNRTIKKVGEDIEDMRFNTAISAMMILVNEIYKIKNAKQDDLEKFLLILSPFAPHLAEELWQKLGHPESIALEKWPEYDPNKIQDTELEIPVQINGKVRAKIKISAGASQDQVVVLAQQEENVQKYLVGAEIKKTIFVPDKLISFVI
ncbi:MAG: class I tRNA ligase family protein [Patescibacteria group bacterium]